MIGPNAEPMLPRRGTIQFIRITEEGEREPISWLRKLLETVLAASIVVGRDIIGHFICLPVDVYMHLTGLTTLSSGYIFDAAFHLLTGGVAILIWYPLTIIVSRAPILLSASRLRMYPIIIYTSMYSMRAKAFLGGMLGLASWQSRAVFLWCLWCFRGRQLVVPSEDRKRQMYALLSWATIWLLPIPATLPWRAWAARAALLAAHLSRLVQ